MDPFVFSPACDLAPSPEGLLEDCPAPLSGSTFLVDGCGGDPDSVRLGVMMMDGEGEMVGSASILFGLFT
jgi:hypothetical protein